MNIQLLVRLDLDDLRRLVTGYSSGVKYQVSQIESVDRMVLTLQRVPLPQPYRKSYDHLDAGTLERYQTIPALGFSFGAYDADQCVGIALAEPQYWNKSLWVWELHVADTHQRCGVGRQLVEALVHRGRGAGLRTLVCETQNTNAPALDFYRSVGFHVEGIDLSYYSNDDFPDGEIAVFMKRRLMPQVGRE